MYMWTWISPSGSWDSLTCMGTDIPGTAFIVSFCMTLLSGNNSKKAMLGAPCWPPTKVPGKYFKQSLNCLGTVQPLDSRVLRRGVWRFFPALRIKWVLLRVLVNTAQFTVFWGGGVLLIMAAVYFATAYPNELALSTWSYSVFRACNATLMATVLFPIIHLAEVSADNCQALVDLEEELRRRDSGGGGEDAGVALGYGSYGK